MSDKARPGSGRPGGKLNAWQQRQQRDTYVKRAGQDGYRSRASYKLLQIEEKYSLLSQGQSVIDLGAAPGGWSQVARDLVGPQGTVVAVDRLPMASLGGVTILEGDFTDDETLAGVLRAADRSEAGVDLVLSDMAPNLSGIRVADQARSMELAELTLDLARRVLRPGGAMVVKCFEGAGIDEFRRDCRAEFGRVVNHKPDASRSASREFYLVATGFSGSEA